MGCNFACDWSFFDEFWICYTYRSFVFSQKKLFLQCLHWFEICNLKFSAFKHTTRKTFKSRYWKITKVHSFGQWTAYMLWTWSFVRMVFYKLNVAILKILLFGHFMAVKLSKKGNHIRLLAIEWPKSKIFKIITPNL